MAVPLKLEGVTSFKPMPGRGMKGYAIWTNLLQRDRNALAQWMGRSLEFARSLPVKDKVNSGIKRGRKPKK